MIVQTCIFNGRSSKEFRAQQKIVGLDNRDADNGGSIILHNIVVFHTHTHESRTIRLSVQVAAVTSRQNPTWKTLHVSHSLIFY